MIVAAISYSILIGLVVTVGALFILCADRTLGVASQHRLGPSRQGYRWGLQVVADIIKALRKTDPSASPSRSNVFFWTTAFSLPYLFAFVLFSPLMGVSLGGFELLLLFIIFLAARVFDAFGLISTANGNEAVLFRRNLVLSAVGITVMIFGCLTIILKVGGGSLGAVGSVQAESSFYLLFRGPGVFLASIAFLCGVFLVSEGLLIGEAPPKSLQGRKNHAFIFLDKLWLFVLICFWVVLFAGGPPAGVSVVSFLIRVGLVLLVVLWSGRILPSVRPHDALELGISVVLPVTLAAFILEGAYLAWMAVGVQ